MNAQEADDKIKSTSTNPPSDAPKKTRTTFRRRRLQVGLVATLAVAVVLISATGGWWLANATLIASQSAGEPPEPAEVLATTASELQMPDVRGLDQPTAEQVLADSGIPVDIVKTHETPSVARAGTVVEQSPAFGDSNLSAIELGVAIPVTMPDLTGKTQEAAVATLSGFGTGVKLTYSYEKDATVGTVLSGMPAVGEPLGQNATLVIATAGSTLPLTQVSTIDGRCSSRSNVAIDGRDFATAMSCTAETGDRSTTTWVLSKAADRFTATVGIADDSEPGTSAPFAVMLDGKVISEGTASFGTSTTIDVTCTGAIQLSVRVGPSSADRVDIVFGEAVLYGSDEGIARLAALR